MADLTKLRAADFEPLLKQVFRLYPDRPFPLQHHAGEDASLELELIEVSELSYGTAGAESARDRRPFSLVFCAAGAQALPQRIYTLEHQALGPLDIFLVPLGPSSDGMRYQAIFT